MSNVIQLFPAKPDRDRRGDYAYETCEECGGFTFLYIYSTPRNIIECSACNAFKGYWN